MKLIAIFALLAVTALAASKKPVTDRLHRNGHFFDHTLALLPDVNSEVGKREMKCTTCKAVMTDIWKALEPVRAEQLTDNRPDRVHKYTDVIENACTFIDNKYGLKTDSNGKATHTMTGDAAVERLRGIWINKFARRECARVVRNTEERILAKIKEFRAEADFVELVCTTWEKACPAL